MRITAISFGKDPQAALAAMRKRVENKQPVMAAIGDALVASTRLRIDASKTPTGETFAPVVRGGKPLRDTSAHIYNALHSRATNDAVVVGVPYAWARVHQFGAVIRAKNVPYLRFLIRGKGWASKKQVTITARPWLGISAFDSGNITDILRRAVQSAAASA
jgi:phage virion morphogenesis protein